jgi:acetone carboxylase beta subunit
MTTSSRPVVCYSDVGGTFTDCFVVTESGEYALGKAPTTPDDIASGFIAALDMAREALGLERAEFLDSLEVVGYGATTVLNSLLTRRGGSPGLLITRGFEDLLLMERGKQSWVQLSRVDRIHPVVHRHQRPLIARQRVKGISERVNSLGQEIIPLREQDVREAVRELADSGVDSIVVVYMWSFLNDEHEQRTKQLITEELESMGRTDIQFFISSEVSPTLRELPRANATTIEAYSGPSTLRGLARLEDDLKAGGFKGDLQVMQSAGGLAPAKHVRAIDTAMSGPVGGLVGTRTIGELYGLESLISTDVGGTSFDVGMVSNGFIGIDREPVVAGLLLSLPMMEVHSIGAGGGTISRIDELSRRLVVGPESAGARPGPVCYGTGGTEPTVTDADLVLGYLSPRGLLNGKVHLDEHAAREAIKEKIAKPLGLSVEDAAEGIRRVIDARMREAVTGLVSLRGTRLGDYVLLAFGGAGPGHVCGYTDKLPLRGVLTFPYAAAFSAYGASTADYEHHYHRAVNVVIAPKASEDELVNAGRRISGAWERLERQAIDQMVLEGFDKEEVSIRHLAMVRYGRQLNDFITPSPVGRCETAADLLAVIAAFEDLYARVFAKGAQFPQAGYEIFEVGLVASAQKIKPSPARSPLEGEDPAAAFSETRDAYWSGEWAPTPRYRWDELRPGNVVNGPAIVEAPTTTLVLPANRRARVDEYRSVWVEQT